VCPHFPFHTPMLTKGKQTLTAAGLPALSCWPYRASAFPPALPKAARSQNYRAFLHVKCFPQTCPKPKHIPVLSAFPKSNKCVPDGYLNNGGGIGRVWRAASFPTSCFLQNASFSNEIGTPICDFPTSGEDSPLLKFLTCPLGGRGSI